ncbi:MAG: arginine repressor [Marinilabiliaceae bacterium]|nr:arginine repressor [Marinilabiliaceae bacterium]
MNIKSKRLLAIKNIISSQKVSSQEELLFLLQKGGYVTTQATLSRDLKFLKVAKVPDAQVGYVYALHEASSKVNEELSVDEFPVSGIESMEFSGNLAVIKTKPGFANGIASVIDSHGLYEILGTIAGDDTILLISREGVTKADVVNALSLFVPGIRSKVV